MPLVSIELGSCTTTDATNRIVQTVTDTLGDGYVDWTENNGILPDSLENNVDVYAQGKRLGYLDEYTITRLITPTRSRIYILIPYPAGMVYDIIAYF